MAGQLKKGGGEDTAGAGGEARGLHWVQTRLCEAAGRLGGHLVVRGGGRHVVRIEGGQN